MVEQMLSAILEEYKALRAEMVNTVDRQYSLINWTISSVALLSAATVNSWDKIHDRPELPTAVFIVALPLLSTLFAVAWSHVMAKIAALGWYLHFIEEKLARYFTADDIRAAYHLAPDTPLEPYRYIMGWEHRLWRASSHVFLTRTMNSIRAVLGFAYLLFLVAGAATLAALTKKPLATAIFGPRILIAAAAWLVVWIALFLHFAQLIRVQSHPAFGVSVRQPKAGTDADDLRTVPPPNSA